jgi:dihydrofolate reductase
VRVVLIDHLTLDGVMQAPGRADEDPRGGFEHGGWSTPYGDEVLGKAMGKRMAEGGPLLLGRRTYEDLFSFWPSQTDNPFTEALNNVRKYVASTTLKEPLPWANSTLLQGDAAEAVSELKEEPGPDIHILGSGELAQSLMRHDLIDEFLLTIHPLVLGSGRRLFLDGGTCSSLELVDAEPTTTGVIIATYRPAQATRP